jgi:ribonuclease I
MKIIYIIALIATLNCQSKKYVCINYVETGKRYSATDNFCVIAIAFQNALNKTNDESKKNRIRVDLDNSLLICLDYKLAMQRCQRKSDIEPDPLGESKP